MPELTDQDRLIAWINGTETVTAYKTGLGAHHPGTCTWVFDRPEFVAWNTSSTDQSSSLSTQPERRNPHLLWIHAPPGFGKTVLAAQIINHLAKASRDQEGNEKDLQAYFFCSSDDFTTQSPVAILRAWIVQLMECQKGRAASEAVGIVHRRLRHGGINASAGEDADLIAGDVIEMFGAVMSHVSSIGMVCTLVIDGYDECEDRGELGASRDSILGELIRTLREASIGSGLVRILVLSRDTEKIRAQLNPDIKESGIEKWDIKVTTEDVKADIWAYGTHLAEVYSKPLGDALTDADREQLVNKMTEKSDGRFLWLKLLESQLAAKSASTASELPDMVESALSSIDDMYNQELNRIAHLPIAPNCGSPEERNIAITLLRWTLFAVRPLTILQHAQAPVWSGGITGLFDTNPGFISIWGPWKRGELSPEDVRLAIHKLTGPLITITPPADHPNAPFESHIIRLAHPSLRLYMYSQLDDDAPSCTWAKSLTLGPTNEEHISLYSLCLKYLDLTTFDDPSPMAAILRGKRVVTGADKGFTSYAAWAWYPHFLSGGSPPKGIEPSFPSFNDKNSQESRKWPDGRQSPLYLAAYFGNLDVIRWCENMGIKAAGPSVQAGGRYGFPLQAAAVGRHVHDAKHMLAKYPNPYPHPLPNEPDEPIDLNSAPQHDKSEPSMGPGEHGSALSAAIGGPLPPSIEMVSLLLLPASPFPVPFVEIHKTDSNGLTPLHHAVKVNSSEVASLLIETGGADLNILTPQFLSPTFIAAGLGNTAVMRVLLSHGADITSHVGKPSIPPSPGQFPTPLQHTSMCSPNSDIISVMLDSLNNGAGHTRGERLEFPDGMGALQACLTNSPAKLKNLGVLLEKGVNPDQADKTRWTPLQVATARGDVEAMRLLVTVGKAKTNRNPGIGKQGGWASSALQMGIVHGQVDAVRVLVKELGADVDECTGIGITPLMTALEEGKQEMVGILLEELGAGLGGVLANNHWGLFDIARKSKTNKTGEGIVGRLVRAGCFAGQRSGELGDEQEIRGGARVTEQCWVWGW
ncbi:hypothetical protein QBC37DRAFT_485314 [Rhypophila decipiens]|uniref:Nephrocystin 3-like N-terminal domain-containing protein n=1 Tax=Rhypophila decipiens TaxID=261697 RepID=A0AAN6Y1P1_9PEZI|nr:hypothetical protein QBC37DRAFT_485314 [Rhypophila decipiens]